MGNMKNFRSALQLLAALAFAASLTVPMLTQPAPEGGWVGFDHADRTTTSNVPAWKPAYANRFHGCTATQHRAIGDLVVVDQAGTAHRMDFSQAWDRNHGAEDADDVWVVGYCH